ncbi:MAG: iron-sulfur cluster assembly accessory protein [Actinomycetota bacterium]
MQPTPDTHEIDPPDTDPVLAVSPGAATRIAALAEKEGRDAPVLRVRVIAGGCSGFSYELGFEDAPAADDQVIAQGVVRVLVDPASSPILAGSTLDFDDALLGGGLKIRNPQAVNECACGDSFSV